jgi:hypothetical protein
MAVLPRLSRLPLTYEKVENSICNNIGSINHIQKESCWQPRQLGQVSGYDEDKVNCSIL